MMNRNTFRDMPTNLLKGMITTANNTALEQYRKRDFVSAID